MTAETLIAALEQEGICLKIEGDRLKLQAPADRVPGPETIARLKENKSAVLEYLREREQPQETQFSSFPTPIAWKTEKLGNWPGESLDAQGRFGQPHAKLFPFIGRKVRTPRGAGLLVQVFAERVTVLLDSDLSKCAVCALAEIEPVSWEFST
jgi:hypothetical protein